MLPERKNMGETLGNYAAAALFLLLFASVAAADFSMRSLTVSLNLNRDGSANIEERLELLINSTQSRELYEATRAAYSDLATWKNRTGLSEMRHHVSRASAEIADLRVLPQPVESCNSFIGTCLATVVIDYKILASSNGSGLVKVDRYKPRTALYSLNQDALSFEQTKTGDLVLPKRTTISITIPAAAENIYFSTTPQNLKDDTENFRYSQLANMRYYTGSKRTFNWQGDTLSKFQFTYEIESPLETEVLEFFSSVQGAVSQLFMGPQGAAAVFLVAVGVATAFGFSRINK